MPVLNFVVSANVTNANQNLGALSAQLAQNALNAARVSGSLDTISAALIPLENNLRNFQTALRAATNPADVALLTRNITALQGAINNIRNGANGIGQSVRGLNQAGNALSNLGRVAQDAPFGFIAIQNNLNPLLESFQRLQRETGSVGGSFKALASTMMSGAGIGLALSLVSSLLVKYPDLLSSMTKEQIAARESLKAFNEEMGKQQGGLQTELTRISSLVQIARDYSESSATRTNAIKELQKEYPGYLANINQENINSQATQKAIDNLTAALERKAKVQAISNLLTKAEEDLFKAQNSTVDDNLSAFEKIGIAFKNFGNLGSGALNAVNTAAKNQSTTIDGLQKNIDNLTSQLDALTRGQAENNDFAGLSPEKLKKTKDKIDQIAETLRKLAIDRDELAKNPLISVDDKDVKNFDLLNAAITRLRDLKLPDNSAIIVKLRAEADEASIQVAVDRFHERMKKTGVSDAVKIPLQASYKLVNGEGGRTAEDALLKEIDDFNKKFKNKKIQLQALSFSTDPKGFEKFKKEATDNIQKQADIMTDVITGIFEKAGDATSIKGFFASIGQTLGEGMKSLGKNLIETSTLIASIKKSLNTALAGNPIAGIGVGIGLMALGNILERSLPKFAEGGLIYGPTVGVMGEYAGASNNPEVVAPLNKLKSMMGDSGGNNTSTELFGRIKGGDIYISNSRTSDTRRRLYGKG